MFTIRSRAAWLGVSKERQKKKPDVILLPLSRFLVVLMTIHTVCGAWCSLPPRVYCRLVPALAWLFLLVHAALMACVLRPLGWYVWPQAARARARLQTGARARGGVSCSCSGSEARVAVTCSPPVHIPATRLFSLYKRTGADTPNMRHTGLPRESRAWCTLAACPPMSPRAAAEPLHSLCRNVHCTHCARRCVNGVRAYSCVPRYGRRARERFGLARRTRVACAAAAATLSWVRRPRVMLAELPSLS